MKANNQAANMRAIQKMRTTAATQLNDQEELSHFDRLPPHLQVHIKVMAAEAFAREHLQHVHAELCEVVALKKCGLTKADAMSTGITVHYTNNPHLVLIMVPNGPLNYSTNDFQSCKHMRACMHDIHALMGMPPAAAEKERKRKICKEDCWGPPCPWGQGRAVPPRRVKGGALGCTWSTRGRYHYAACTVTDMQRTCWVFRGRGSRFESR